MSSRALDRLIHRYQLGGEVRCETAVHVGKGRAFDTSATCDLPILRDAADLPYLPGASLRGALRSGLESVLRGLGNSSRAVCDPLRRVAAAERENCAEQIHRTRQALTAPPDEEEAFALAWEKSCDLCRIFGNTFLASRVRVGDLRLLSPPSEALVLIRNGVGIDRDLRTARKGGLYDFEAIAPGARFELRMEIENVLDHELGLILTGLDLFAIRSIGLGGKRARGLGDISIQILTLQRRVAADFFTGEPGQKMNTDHLKLFRQRAREFYLKESS